MGTDWVAPATRLVVEDLTVKTADGQRVLVDTISLSVEPGERVAVVGASGAGKTLLGRAIVHDLPEGLQKTSGTVCLKAVEDHRERSTEPLLSGRACATMLPQIGSSAIPPLARVGSLIRDVISWCPSRDQSSDAVMQECEQLLTAVGLGDTPNVHLRRAHELSGGMAARVACAAALATRPSILVLDEPTSGLDPVTRKAIASLLHSFNQLHGVSLILTTHDVWLAASLCERVLVLRQGQLVGSYQTSEIEALPTESYAGRLFSPLRKPTDIRRTSSYCPRGKGTVTSAVEAEDIKVVFRAGLWRGVATVALNDVSMAIVPGTALGVVGPSGSGKSTLALTCAGLLRPNMGRVMHEGLDVYGDRSRRRTSQRFVQMVFQNPFAALNPRRTIGESISIMLRRRKGDTARTAGGTHAYLDLVRLPSAVSTEVPGRLSGGECQRACIAACLAAGAHTLILDEPLNMLDPIVQEEIIELLVSLREDGSLSYLLVSHDFALVSRLCEQVLVLSEGTVVETGTTTEMLENPKHRITQELVGACPWRSSL